MKSETEGRLCLAGGCERAEMPVLHPPFTLLRAGEDAERTKEESI